MIRCAFVAAVLAVTTGLINAAATKIHHSIDEKGRINVVKEVSFDIYNKKLRN